LGAAPFAFKGAVFPWLGPLRRNGARVKGVHGPTLRYEGWGTRSKVLGEMSNRLLVLSGRKKPCASRRFFGIRESRHHLTGTEGANSIIFWAIWARNARFRRCGELPALAKV
jgi:hypothetical protein